MDTYSIFIAFMSLGFGGVLKGATGVGAPLIAVPALALIFDVPTAIAIFSIPNLLTNALQAWRFWPYQKSKKLVWGFAISGVFGISIGTYFLATLSPYLLQKSLALVVLAFVAFKILNSTWFLSRDIANKLAPIAGFCAGILQGVSGLSAPISLSFLNSMKLERREFIATINVFFTVTALPQIILLIYFDILTVNRSLWSALSLIPVLMFMPLGQYLAQKWSNKIFEQIINSLLFLISIRLLFD